jgi:predicted metal-binding protein
MKQECIVCDSCGRVIRPGKTEPFAGHGISNRHPIRLKDPDIYNELTLKGEYCCKCSSPLAEIISKAGDEINRWIESQRESKS